MLLRSALLTLAISSAALCADAVPDASLTVEPTVHLFGVTDFGASSPPLAFTVRNKSGSAISIGTALLSGTHPDQYRFGADNCSGTSLAASGSCTIEVEFVPTSRGNKAANLQIPWDDGVSHTLTAFAANFEGQVEEAERRVPPTVYSIANLPETMTAGDTYAVTWQLLGYGEAYTSYVAFFDCTGIPSPDCGASYADPSRFDQSAALAPVATAPGPWNYNGNPTTLYTYTYNFTPPVTGNFTSPTDIVVRFYQKSAEDGALGYQSLSLLIPGNLSGTYYDTEGRRIRKTVTP
jgi:hypothetical protein